MRVEPRPAATVMVVRDAPKLQVLMLQRNNRSAFAGGAHVFPGGAVDDGDGGFDLAVSRGLTAELVSYAVAGIRETFEEAGLLLAADADGEFLRFDVPETKARLDAARTALNDKTATFDDILAREGLVPAVGQLYAFAHWITPEGAPRRFDTRFFVAGAPEFQDPSHDDGETVEGRWFAPSEALDLHRDGAIELIFPTIRNLQAINRFETASMLLDAVSQAYEVADPEVVREGNGTRIRLPGDAD